MQEEEHETDPDSRSDIKADILEFQRKFQLEFKEQFEYEDTEDQPGEDLTANLDLEDQ